MNVQTGTKTGISSDVKVGGAGIFTNTVTGPSSSYLLDNFPSAAAAFSVYKLSSTYNGPCMSIRRSGDNAQTLVYFKDDLLDIEIINNFCNGENGYISKWYNQVGNGNDATQTIASSQAKIFDSINGVILENGKPAIDATDIFIALRADISSLDIMTSISVSKITDGSSNRYITDSASGRFIIGSFSGTGKYTAFRSSQLSGDVLDTSKLALHFAKFDGANSELTTNSGTTYTGDAGTSTFTEFRIGSGLGGFRGTIQEIIIYPNDQSTNRLPIENNINNRYNIY